MQLVMFRCTAFGRSFSGPWWTVPVRKNIQMFLGKNPPWFQRMCLKPCFSERSRNSSRKRCHQIAHKAFLAPAGTMQLSAVLWDHIHHRCFVVLPLALTDTTHPCGPSLPVLLLNTYSSSAIFWHCECQKLTVFKAHLSPQKSLIPSFSIFKILY